MFIWFQSFDNIWLPLRRTDWKLSCHPRLSCRLPAIWLSLNNWESICHFLLIIGSWWWFRFGTDFYFITSALRFSCSHSRYCDKNTTRILLTSVHLRSLFSPSISPPSVPPFSLSLKAPFSFYTNFSIWISCSNLMSLGFLLHPLINGNFTSSYIRSDNFVLLVDSFNILGFGSRFQMKNLNLKELRSSLFWPTLSLHQNL